MNALSSDETNRLFGTGNRDQALMLLGRGMSTGKVAEFLSVSASLISQYLEDEGFKDKVAELRMESQLARSLRDEAYDSLEDKVLAQLDENMCMITKPMELVAVLKTVNGLVRRGTPEPIRGMEGNKNAVLIELPTSATNAHLAVQLEFSTQGEVVEVDGRAMRTMSTEKVIELAKSPLALEDNSKIGTSHDIAEKTYAVEQLEES